MYLYNLWFVLYLGNGQLFEFNRVDELQCTFPIRHIQENLFRYLYSTAPRPSMQPTKAPLAGYGYGLPLSRLYARYFHGDLILNSCEGYGTDAIVYLKTKEAEAMELLPVYNKTSTKQYREAIQLNKKIGLWFWLENSLPAQRKWS